MKLKEFLVKYKWQTACTGLGLMAGYLYWYFIGCSSGTCPIQSQWHTSALYGGMLGYFISDLKKKPKQKEEKPDETI